MMILESHQGRDEAMSRKALVEQVCDLEGFEVGERKIRIAIKHLIAAHGAAIGSCHNGYFMAQTSDEIEGVCKYFDGYGLSSLFISAKLRKIEMKDFLGQLQLKY